MTSASSLPAVHLYWLYGGLALAAAPHALRLPVWVNLCAAGVLAWRVLITYRQGALPHRRLLLFFAIAGIAGVYLTYRTIFGRDAGVTLLVLLMALKLLEMRVLRDVFIGTFLAYFLALTNFFYSQTIPTALVMFATVVLITASLVGFNAPQRPVALNLQTAGVLFAQAGPIMVLLFFLFPRVPGPLWGLPQDAFAGVTGLGDSMSPGAISRLSQSDAIAFRAKFEGRLPSRRELYWRGPVFWEFDGRTWRPGVVRLRPGYQFEALGGAIDYEVTLEAHNRHWLFGLDLPARVPGNARATSDYQLLSLPPVRNRIRYELRSYPEYRALSGAEREDLQMARELPEEFNPRAAALAREWRRTLGRDDAIVRQALAFFRSGGFEYTLTPPLLGTHSVDEFLFGTKQGFCEHFASSFTVLMRAAGIPARVVTGYQGGELNPVDGYMVVRQSDAHAWSEVWMPERGWVRVDPTAVVVPLRVDAGIAAAVPQSGALPLLLRGDIGWLRAVRDNWEAIANRWNQWVLGYNFERQRDVMNYFGVQTPSWQTLAMLLFWSIGGMLGLIALWLLARFKRHDPVQRAWLRFCRKLSRAGLARSSSEGPFDFASRAASRLPGRAELIHRISRLYVDLRYGDSGLPEDLARLKLLVRRFQP